ncbi:hypothetical protein WA026_009679 [Henosepilachna vigintioctopunctata]|uniref:Uncharacterized protein n=1 Tax=Henosepilachna vigintioctopunctata TaxID=420089 RepID=A0AAW1TWD4_9CUCU
MKLVLEIVISSLCFVYLLQLTSSANNVKDDKLNSDWSYCFEFTWFGPDYDNSTQYNGTCADYLEETRGKGIPCSPPIVITYNGTFPDVEYLWQHHKKSVVCRRGSGQVCARYAYYYNGAMKNATFMCTKVQVVGEEAVRSGCYNQKVRDYEVEVCVCESGKGPFKPCNIFS